MTKEQVDRLLAGSEQSRLLLTIELLRAVARNDWPLVAAIRIYFDLEQADKAMRQLLRSLLTDQ